MRITLVFNSPTRLVDSSIKYERFLRGFRELGHEATIVCTAASAEGIDWAETVADSRHLAYPSLWSNLSPNMVLLPTWLGMSKLLTAIRPHTRYLVGLADSDGYVGARSHPRQTLSRMLAIQTSLPGKLVTAGWWLRQYLAIDRSVDQEAIASCQLCDRIGVFSGGARDNLRKFLQVQGFPQLTRRVSVFPYPVDDQFEELSVPSNRLDCVLAIGRWEDPQKDSSLLVNAIREYVIRGGQSTVILVGSGGEARFDSLLSEFEDQVEYRGVVSQSQVGELFNQCRVLLSTSRWESGPIVAAEAMLRGCSLVGAASIPAFRAISDAGCGTVFGSRRPEAVANALAQEIQAWNQGVRKPEEIASKWRGHFTARVVCSRILAEMNEPCAFD